MVAFPARNEEFPDDLEGAILDLKRERNAVLLAHYYQESEVQDLADFVGDSLALAQAAARLERDVIAFCGVHFMAETAKILNPNKPVVVPDLEAGNMLAKQLSYLAGAEGAGIVMGTRVPIVLTSRADSLITRLASCAVAAIMANARREHAQRAMG